jgi:ABC-type dipeptide/oligopeptide/nickel transport system ATPase subunit
MSYDLRFKHPFSCIIAGPSGSGKSSFCIKLLQNLESLFTKPSSEGGILWCYGEKNAVHSIQFVSGNRIQFHERVLKNFENSESLLSLITLDDLLNEVYSEEVCHFFTKGCHHRNICVILITQNLFQQERYCRAISLNAKYIVLIKNVGDKHQFSHLARQVNRKIVLVCTKHIYT